MTTEIQPQTDVHFDLEALIAQHSDREGPLLPILHAVQQAEGFIPPAAVPTIATALRMTRAEVHGVISFYHFFKTQAGGKHRLQICRAESCQAPADSEECGADQKTLGDGISGKVWQLGSAESVATFFKEEQAEGECR